MLRLMARRKKKSLTKKERDAIKQAVGWLFRSKKSKDPEIGWRAKLVFALLWLLFLSPFLWAMSKCATEMRP